MKNKILLDLERLRYSNSGVAHICRNLALGFKQLGKKNIILFGPKKEIKELETTFQIEKWHNWNKFLTPFLGKYKVVHVWHQLSSYFFKVKKHQMKVVTLHDLNCLHEDHLPKKKVDKMIALTNKNLEYADYIVCISNFVKEDFLKNKHIFTLKSLKEIFVVYNGLQFPNLEKQYQLGQFSYLKEKKYALNIGVLFPKKNQHVLIEMLPNIEEDLVIVASGIKPDYQDNLLKRAEELGVEKRIHILKNITEEEKWALLQNCESLLHPSLAEGFGIPPIEAMYFGKPVFLSNLTSLPEIGGELAFYFDNFSPENMTIIYKSGMKNFSENKEVNALQLHNWAMKFDYIHMAKSYAEIYEKALSIKK